MSRGYTPRHAQTAGDLSFAVQFNDETLASASQIAKPSLNPLYRLRKPITENPMIRYCLLINKKILTGYFFICVSKIYKLP